MKHFRGKLLWILICLLLDFLGCAEPKEKVVVSAGDCDEVELQSTLVQYREVSFLMDCLDTGLLELISSLDGLAGEYDEVIGNYEFGDYRMALLLLSDAQALEALQQAGCVDGLPADLEMDWSAQSLVLASFEGGPGCEEESQFELMEELDGRPHLSIDFHWTPDDKTNCVALLNYGLLLESAVPPAVCLELLAKPKN